MLVIPAIDVYAGRCVRLFQGSFSHTTRYTDDPADRARAFADLGAVWLHVVDLDAAEGKGADNRAVISRIRAAVTCRIQVGGGIRSGADADALVEMGIDRVVIGTALIRAPREVEGWASRFSGRLAAGIDARDGRVKVSGWAEDAGISDLEAAGRLAGLGLVGLVYTNISRDGTLAGPDIERTKLAARAAGLPTILSGGIGSEDDVKAVFDCQEPLVRGVILGKALYEGAVDLKTLLDRFTWDRGETW